MKMEPCEQGLKAGLPDHIHVKFASHCLCDRRMWSCNWSSQVTLTYVRECDRVNRP